MNLSDIIIHNNELFYNEDLTNNFQVVGYLFDRGYLQSLSELSKKEKKEFSLNDLNKVEESFKLATCHLLKCLVKKTDKILLKEKLDKQLNYSAVNHLAVNDEASRVLSFL